LKSRIPGTYWRKESISLTSSLVTTYFARIPYRYRVLYFCFYLHAADLVYGVGWRRAKIFEGNAANRKKETRPSAV